MTFHRSSNDSLSFSLTYSANFWNEIKFNDKFREKILNQIWEEAYSIVSLRH